MNINIFASIISAVSAGVSSFYIYSDYKRRHIEIEVDFVEIINPDNSIENFTKSNSLLDKNRSVTNIKIKSDNKCEVRFLNGEVRCYSNFRYWKKQPLFLS